MEKVLRKIFVAGVLLTGAAVALLPTTSYAVEATGDDAKDPSKGASMQSNFNLTVNKAITLTSMQGPTIDAEVGQVKDGFMTGKVYANSPFNIYVHAKEHSDLQNTANPTVSPIPTLGGSNLPASATGWGIKGMDGTAEAALFQEVGVGDANKIELYDSTAANGTGNAGLGLNFKIGVVIQASQPDGTYTTDLVVTAVSK